MLRIEEYILKRKKEDRLNEFDIDARNENMRLCVNYVFEYYNNYLNITEAEERTVLKDEKLEKYYHQLRDYEPEVKDWLVGIYSEYGKQLNRYIGNILKEDSFFYLYNTDSEFRNLSYDCYSKLIKKFPYLKDQTEMLFLFIKEYHRVLGQGGSDPSSVYISEEISEWVQGTCAKYQVNLLEFAFRWVNDFYDNEDTWPSTHRKKSPDSWRKYEYDHKQKSNLFNIDSMYRKMPKKPYTKGKKQEFEILFMYYWLNSIVGDNENYWQDYLEKTLSVVKPE